MKYAHKPWLTKEAVKFLDSIIHSKYRVLEFGSGSSTIYFAERVKHVCSVEHAKVWHEAVGYALEDKGLKNTCRFLIPDPITSVNYRKYILNLNKYISRCPNEAFDIVLVDGRKRDICIRYSSFCVKKGGWLILDNYDTEKSQKAVDGFLLNWEPHFFDSPGWGGKGTAFYRKPL